MRKSNTVTILILSNLHQSKVKIKKDVRVIKQKNLTVLNSTIKAQTKRTKIREKKHKHSFLKRRANKFRISEKCFEKERSLNKGGY